MGGVGGGDRALCSRVVIAAVSDDTFRCVTTEQNRFSVDENNQTVIICIHCHPAAHRSCGRSSYCDYAFPRIYTTAFLF